MTGERPVIEVDRILTTVLFTDIVSSTERAASLGDKGWRSLLDAHDRMARDLLRLFRGREINTTGDGFVVSFDGPARAIRCGKSRSTARESSVSNYGSVYTRVSAVRGDDLGGLAVHVAARVGSLASPGEVLVSSTVKDLVAGSGIQFEDRGDHELKGVPGMWKLFAAVSWIRTSLHAVGARHPRASREADLAFVTVTQSGCRWCGRKFAVVVGGAGRPRLYCKRSCRQRDYEARRRALELGLGEHELVVTRAELESIRDRLYMLEHTIKDAENDLAQPEAPPPAPPPTPGSPIMPVMSTCALQAPGGASLAPMTPEDLVEIELIKRLKYKYARCLDQKLWDEIAECFTAGRGRGVQRRRVLVRGPGRDRRLPAPLDGRRDVPFEPQDASSRDRPHRPRYGARRLGARRRRGDDRLRAHDPRLLVLRGRVRQARRHVAHPDGRATSACSRRCSPARRSRDCA